MFGAHVLSKCLVYGIVSASIVMYTTAEVDLFRSGFFPIVV